MKEAPRRPVHSDTVWGSPPEGSKTAPYPYGGFPRARRRQDPHLLTMIARIASLHANPCIVTLERHRSTSPSHGGTLNGCDTLDFGAIDSSARLCDVDPRFVQWVRLGQRRTGVWRLDRSHGQRWLCGRRERRGFGDRWINERRWGRYDSHGKRRSKRSHRRAHGYRRIDDLR